MAGRPECDGEAIERRPCPHIAAPGARRRRNEVGGVPHTTDAWFIYANVIIPLELTVLI